MRWKALLMAVPASGVAIVLIELTRLPLESPSRSLAAFALLGRGAASAFSIPAALAGLVAATLAVRLRPSPSPSPSPNPSPSPSPSPSPNPSPSPSPSPSPKASPSPSSWSRLTVVRFLLLVALGFAQVAVAREGLIAYGPFAWSVPLNLALAGLGVGVAAGYVWFLRPTRRVGWLGLGVALASLVLVRAHYVVYVGLYPTLHQCLLQLAFIGSVLGIGLALASFERSLMAQRVGLVAVLGLAVLGAAGVPEVDAMRPLVTAHTELGRGVFVAEALARDRAYLLPRALPRARDSRLLRPDADAEARFAAHAGLPEIEPHLQERDVLLVLTDATRFDRTSLASPERGTTPHLLALARRGAHVFTRAYAPSNGTFQSLASMFAMRPVSFAEIDIFPRHWRGRLREGRPTAAELFRADGRQTFWVGHDHVNCFSEHILGLERGFDERVLVEERRGDAADVNVDAEIAEAAVERIESARGRFFGFVFFVSPHNDYRGGYDAELRRFDAALGRVLGAVDLSRTIVIVAGDHGEAFGEHGHQHHLSSVYDEQIHVPLLVWIPGDEAGAWHTRPTSTGYVLPWLLLQGSETQRAGARAALREDIGPLMRALDGAVVSEMIGNRRQIAALTWDHTTLVYDVLAGLPRVFDADEDPGQRRDLREQDPARFERMLPFVDRYRRARYEGRRFRFAPEDRR